MSPSPSLSVPFRRDSDFVNHGMLLDQIHEKCSAPASRVALESQIAIEHCYRTADRSPETRIEQGYRAIAEQVKLGGWDDPQVDVFQLVYNWLRNEKNGKWLQILDNADDAAALSLTVSKDQKIQISGRDGARPRYFSSYLPQCKNGSVLVTSRTRSVALQFVEENDIIVIKPMDNAGAQTLLQKKLGELIDNDGSTYDVSVDSPQAGFARNIMLLALHTRCSVRQYLEQFYKSDREETGLLDYEEGRLQRDDEANNSILMTWQISFDYILHARRSAADLLSLMSFFDRQGIPEALVHTRNNEHSDGDDIFLTLKNYSFISLTTDPALFNMHRLVQLAMRKWLERQGQVERWKQQYIHNLCTNFPTGEHKNWVQRQLLFSHARLALSQRPNPKESLQQWALLLYEAAWYAWAKGNPIDAEKLSKSSMKVRIKLFGKEHEDTLNSVAMVGLATQLAGWWKKFEELEVQMMETSSRVLGREYPNTLTSMANLASTFWNQGRWKETKELEVQVMGMRKRVLGEEHPDTLTSMANLASTYRKFSHTELHG
ncbi:hypothetical protein GQ43DRAFT_458302 [Delitschia confertaspora ATCC 74209]|uniref:Tetratricopeptide repeat protein n=1 Tax=Delitschia confertaspora ATCC 74209 TaxID=1513339 RepID=A0A9P4JJC4_9PLEO|nr:hypothetical protein GQ43DRAFT_458302 [Delitschia confertaspora ATCC 74209]